MILYDTGEGPQDGARIYAMLRAVTQAPVRAIIYSHEHYTKGAQAIVDAEKVRGNADIKIIGNADTNMEMARTRGAFALHPEAAPVLSARALEQFNAYLPASGPDAGFKNTIKLSSGGFVPVNTPVRDGDRLSVAGLDLVFRTEGIATDSLVQLMVWIPEKRTVLNNVVWGWFPNIYSARGGGYRDPRLWRNAVDMIRALKPEVLLSTHSTSLAGAQDIEKRLLDYRDALSFVLDQTLKGILLGQNPGELRYSVKLPPRLANSPILIQNYGDLAPMPARIYDALFGPFDGDAAKLNLLRPVDEARRMVEAMGGRTNVARRVTGAMAKGDYLWACQLAGYLVRSEPTSANRQLKANCLRAMGQRALATNSRSWYLSQARELEGKTAILKAVPIGADAVSAQPEDYVDYYRVRINAQRAAKANALIGIELGGSRRYGLHVHGGVVDFIPELDKAAHTADVVVSTTPAIWTQLFNNQASVDSLIDAGKISVVEGDPAEAKQLFALFDPIFDWKSDPALIALAASYRTK